MNEQVIWKAGDGLTHVGVLRQCSPSCLFPRQQTSLETSCGIVVIDPQEKFEPPFTPITCPDCLARFVIVI